jgi:hypothetical protein
MQEKYEDDRQMTDNDNKKDNKQFNMTDISYLFLLFIHFQDRSSNPE